MNGTGADSLVVRLFAESPEPTLIYHAPPEGGAPAVLAANAAFERFFAGFEAAGLSSPLRALSGDRTDGRVLNAITAAAAAGRAMRATLALYPRRGGPLVWVDVSGYTLALPGAPVLWIEHYRDATGRLQRQDELARERDQLQRTLASMADAVMTLDTRGNLRFMNQAARKLLDLRGVVAADRLARADDQLLQLRDIETEEVQVAPFALSSPATRKARALIMTQTGGRRYIEYAVSPVRRSDGRPDGVVVLLRDITAEEVLTRQLSFEAGHDQLTGIANRRRFDQALARALSSAKSEAQQHTLAFLDLDRFKSINDSCGHAAGDQVLREVAQLFKAQLRSHDVIARFGGDEFAILMHDCSPKTASRVINRIRAAISMYRWHWQGRDFTLGVSIGLAEITQHTPDTEKLLRDADAACYADKATHRNHEGRLPTATADDALPAPRVPWTR